MTRCTRRRCLPKKHLHPWRFTVCVAVLLNLFMTGNPSFFLTFVDCKRKLNRTMAVTPSVVYTGCGHQVIQKNKGAQKYSTSILMNRIAVQITANPPLLRRIGWTVESVCHWGRCVCRMVFKCAQQLQRLLQLLLLLRPAGAGLLHGV
jgi:hypothetical protein